MITVHAPGSFNLSLETQVSHVKVAIVLAL